MLNVVIIGHVYNIYDSFMNMDMLKKLENNGVKAINIDMLKEDDVFEKLSSLNKRMFWNFGSKAIGGALHILDRKDIDGVIYLMSFGCGVDSFVADMIERRLRRSSDIPFIVLTIDEHSGEAGMDTRLEAFIDMIRWRKKDETDISAHG
jgi:predicted nucleotide-binding protein (sugar kinase/HSP70/actin superfamily)